MLIPCLLSTMWPAAAQEARDADPRQNLALGKPALYLPAPDYGLTAEGDSDAQDLTDGRLTERADQCMWFETLAVGWSYSGRVNLALDLGEVQPIAEVAVRFMGGSPQAGVTMPGWVELVVADTLEGPYHKVAEYSKWRPGEAARFGVPAYEGRPWVHRLRFTDLQTRGRYVGLRFYAGGLSCIDEMFVFAGEHDPRSATFDEASLTDFTLTQAAPYLHKPLAHVTSNIVTPLTLGCVAAPREAAEPMSVTLTLPEGVEALAGSVGGVPVAEAQVGGALTFTFSTKGESTKTFGRLYLTGAPRDGAAPELQYQLTWGGFQSPRVTVPMEFIEIPPQPVQPRRLMTSLSWWDLGSTKGWPRWEEAFARIGFNTVPAMATWLNPEDQETLDFAAEVRTKGFRLQAIDSPWHRMLESHASDPELYCQFADGTHGPSMCPSYRGPRYEEELQRIAIAVRLLQPSYLALDIELWSWQGPLDAEKCTRCQADKAARGVETWEEWKLQQGEAMWSDLRNAVQRAVQEGGGPPCEMGGYDFRPGVNYQFFWPFDRLYPEAMQSGQVSTYTPLEPYHIELIGNEVRKDRAKLPRSDQLPWITPGDAGTFPGEAFYHALLEVFCNGSRGVNFWSSRVWDGDLLAAYARAVRAVAPVEDILIDGQPFLPEVEGPGRVSGMRLGDEIVLLVADYHGVTDGTVRVKLDVPQPVTVTDLDRREEISRLEAGPQVLAVDLQDETVKVLRLRP